MVLYFLSDEVWWQCTLLIKSWVQFLHKRVLVKSWTQALHERVLKHFSSTSFHISRRRRKKIYHNTTSDVAVSEIHAVTETVMAAANVHSATFTPKLRRSRDSGRTTIRRQHNTQHAHPPSWGWGSAWVSFKWTSVTGAPLRKPREQQQATQTTFKRRSNCEKKEEKKKGEREKRSHGSTKLHRKINQVKPHNTCHKTRSAHVKHIIMSKEKRNSKAMLVNFVYSMFLMRTGGAGKHEVKT